VNCVVVLVSCDVTVVSSPGLQLVRPSVAHGCFPLVPSWEAWSNPSSPSCCTPSRSKPSSVLMNLPSCSKFPSRLSKIDILTQLWNRANPNLITPTCSSAPLPTAIKKLHPAHPLLFLFPFSFPRRRHSKGRRLTHSTPPREEFAWDCLTLLLLLVWRLHECGLLRVIRSLPWVFLRSRPPTIML
jgi:hypothetical protein